MDLSKYSVKSLRDIIRQYNLHTHIVGFSRMGKTDLISSIQKFLNFIDNEFIPKSQKFSIKKPDEMAPKKPPTRKKKEEPKTEPKKIKFGVFGGPVEKPKGHTTEEKKGYTDKLNKINAMIPDINKTLDNIEEGIKNYNKNVLDIVKKELESGMLDVVDEQLNDVVPFFQKDYSSYLYSLTNKLDELLSKFNRSLLSASHEYIFEAEEVYKKNNKDKLDFDELEEYLKNTKRKNKLLMIEISDLAKTTINVKDFKYKKKTTKGKKQINFNFDILPQYTKEVKSMNLEKILKQTSKEGRDFINEKDEYNKIEDERKKLMKMYNKDIDELNRSDYSDKITKNLRDTYKLTLSKLDAMKKEMANKRKTMNGLLKKYPNVEREYFHYDGERKKEYD